MKPCILFIGAPGSGKGSQTERLKAQFGFITISTGDLIRDQIKRSTPIGLKVAPFLNEGKLVPDTLIIELFQEWIQENQHAPGFIIDGFPRTIYQAENFSNIIVKKYDLKIAVIHLDVSLEVLTKRILSRLLCTNCNLVYNTDSKPPAVNNTCDRCKIPLTRRRDDTKEAIGTRHAEYLAQTQPLLEFFENRVVNVNGNQSSDDVFNAIILGLENVSFN